METAISYSCVHNGQLVTVCTQCFTNDSLLFLFLSQTANCKSNLVVSITSALYIRMGVVRILLIPISILILFIDTDTYQYSY